MAERIGRYEVVKELKGGGMGSVTLCRAPDGRLVVLKRPYSIDDEAAVRLRDEARIGSRLLHPGLVDTLDLFEHEGMPVLVVAYVDGPSLEVLRNIGPLPIAAVARIGRQIADALDALHCATDENGELLHILHRDVTPGNIVVSKEGDARLIDLGIARFSERQAERTQDGFLRGTMRYLAPELLEGETYSESSDLWSLGLVLWEAALGRFGYGGESDREVLAGIVLGQPMKLKPKESVDLALVSAIEPLLQRAIGERTKDAATAAARFAALEDKLGDTAAATRDAIDELLAWKENTDPSREELDRRLLGLGPSRPTTGFTDEETFAEPLAELLDTPSGEGVAGVLETSALEPKETVAIPAPIRFSTATGQAERAPPRDDAKPSHARDLHPNVADDEDEDDAHATHVDLPLIRREISQDETEKRVQQVHAALAELGDDVDSPGPFPGLIEDDDDGDDTISISTPAIPTDALRSDQQDLDERAAGFDEGVDVELPPVAVAGPPPQLDAEDLEQMHTLDGLVPIQKDEPPEVTLRGPPPAPHTEASVDSYGLGSASADELSADELVDDEPTAEHRKPSDKPHRKAHRHSPSWDAVAAVKAASKSKSLAHFVRGGAGDPVSVPSEDSARVAQVELLKKSPDEVERDRVNQRVPEPGVSKRIDIDALPAARPLPRDERPAPSGPSPFQEPTEVLPPSASLLQAAAGPAPALELPQLEVRDRTEVETQKVRKLQTEHTQSVDGLPDSGEGESHEPDLQLHEPLQVDEDEDEGDPTLVDLNTDDLAAHPLNMDTRVGAKIQELPAPAAPLQPLGPFVVTEALGDDGDKEPVRKFQQGEVVSLSEMANLLDDD